MGELKHTPLELSEMFDYLDQLRESGVTNMFGASPYLKKEFKLKNDDAGNVLMVWMSTFSRDKPADERASDAIAKQKQEMGDG